LINESNHLFGETKTIDSDLNTLVYENYTKFISATDLTHSINMSLSSDEITNDLEDLKGTLKSINAGHQEIESNLKLKLKQIKKMDILQKDLDKLRYLSELPEMFKEAIELYETSKNDRKDPNSRSISDEIQSIDIQSIFGKTLGLYQDYSDILIVYKKTKFMQDLYSDIKSYVQKVKIILTAELETLQSQDVVFVEGGDNKMICPAYQKKLKDIIQLLLLIVCT
jgi:hypothetical protein